MNFSSLHLSFPVYFPPDFLFLFLYQITFTPDPKLGTWKPQYSQDANVYL